MASAALGVIIIAGLYWAQTIIIPIALAIFLTFILAPVVNFLQHCKLGRTPSVIVTVVLAGVLLVGIGWAVSYQVAGLVASLNNERYTENIRRKVQTVEQWMQGGLFEDVRQFIQEVGKAQPSAGDAKSEPTVPPPDPNAANPPRTVVVEPTSSALARIPDLLSRAAEPLAQTALVLVLVIFMLARREDLRNRLIRLIGHGRLTLTTMAVDDAGQRVSRFLFVQMIVNVTYGLVFSAGLYVLGVDYAFLWGFLAAVMRYVPYLGVWVAIVPPIGLSLAAATGWSQPLWVIGLVAVMEIVTANFIEPIVFGQSIGVSEVALLISAAFWAWLWGPIGLVLSAPLTVCLVVLGKHVPQLEFFDILLGDAPALPPRVVLYQRLLAHDQDEAAEVVDQAASKGPREQVYDDLLLPTLATARRDRERGDLPEPDQQAILAAVRELAEELAEREPIPADSGANRPADGVRVRVLGCPARDAGDELALNLFRDLLDPVKWAVEVLSPDTLSSELLDAVEKVQPAAVCIGALPPGALAHTRYLCKRLRQRFPDVKLLVGLWGLSGDKDVPRQALMDAGADAVAITLADARQQLTEWLPVFQAETAAPAEAKGHERVEQLI
jgi:predicted PurR-regulated permease PerM